jgi:hypothetical protein
VTIVACLALIAPWRRDSHAAISDLMRRHGVGAAMIGGTASTGDRGTEGAQRRASR